MRVKKRISKLEDYVGKTIYVSNSDYICDFRPTSLSGLAEYSHNEITHLKERLKTLEEYLGVELVDKKVLNYQKKGKKK